VREADAAIAAAVATVCDGLRVRESAGLIANQVDVAINFERVRLNSAIAEIACIMTPTGRKKWEDESDPAGAWVDVAPATGTWTDAPRRAEKFPAAA
jgi:hypothetical protein